ncbi:MAG: Holliday junction resolvase RuvX [Pseudomonadota bacterium]
MCPAAALWLGFDFGERRIGVAVGQAVTGTARPLVVLPTKNRGQPDWPAIERVLREWRPEGVVVGVPRRDDGSDYPVTPQAERFARQLHGRFGLRVETVDERLSSFEASDRFARSESGIADRRGRRPSSMDGGGQRLGFDKRATAVDAGAAAVILETWFSEHISAKGSDHAES